MARFNHLELKRLRELKGISQYELAMETGLEPANISKMERPNSTEPPLENPSFETVAKLAEFFEVDEETLLTYS